MFLSAKVAVRCSAGLELFYRAIKNRPLKPVSILNQLHILVQLRTRPVVIRVALALVYTTEVDQ